MTQFEKSLHTTYPTYFDEISSGELTEKNRSLINAIKQKGRNCPEASEIICRNFGMIHDLIQKYYFGNDVEQAELDLANIMLHAAELFDMNSGTQFSTYFYAAAATGLRNLSAEENQQITVPANLYAKYKVYLKNQEQYSTYSDDEICQELHITRGDLANIRRIPVVSSLDATVTDDDRIDTTVGDMIIDHKTTDDYDRLVTSAAVQDVLKKVNLSDKERYVLEHLYGIDCDVMSTSELCDELNISKQRVNQLVHKALFKTKQYMVHANHGRDTKNMWLEGIA